MHAKLVGGEGAEGGAEDGGVHAGGGSPLEALEEDILGVVAMLVGMEDVALALENPTGGTRHEARLVRAGQQGGQGEGFVGDGSGHEQVFALGRGADFGKPTHVTVG